MLCSHHEETRSCLEKETMQGTMPGARRRGRPRTAWMDNIKTLTGLSVRVNQNDRGQIYRPVEKVRPWCGQPSDRGRLKNRTAIQDSKFPRLEEVLTMTS